MCKLFLVLIGVGLGALGGGSATAAPGVKPAIATDGGVIAAHYRGRGYYGGGSYYPRYYGRGYGYYYYPRYYGYYPGYYGGGYYGGTYGYNRRNYTRNYP